MIGDIPGVESLGWLATAVFVASYFAAGAGVLRLLQMSGALLWVIYGLVIASMPVVVANVLVFTAALVTVLRARRGGPPGGSAATTRALN